MQNPNQLSRRTGCILHDEAPFICCYRKKDLLKLHQHFMHPSARQLYRLLKIADSEKTTPKVKKLMEIKFHMLPPFTTYIIPSFRFRANFHKKTKYSVEMCNGRHVSQ